MNYWLIRQKAFKASSINKIVRRTIEGATQLIMGVLKIPGGLFIGDFLGNISNVLSDLLFGNGIQLITQVKKNMKKQALSNEEKLLLRKRAVIETVNDELKNICQVEHTRHLSISGFLLNIMGAIAAYSFFPKKPPIKKIPRNQSLPPS